MSNLGQSMQPPPPESLPSTRRLMVLSLIAVFGVALVTVGIALPAERGVDPTGLGRLTGLTLMGQIKVALAMDFADHQYDDSLARATDSTALVAAGADAAGAASTGETRVLIAPHDSSEIQLVMKAGAQVAFSWTADSSVVDVLIFGDPLNKSPRARHRYTTEAGRQSSRGELVAAFDGFHGLRWYNLTNRVVVVTLRTQGRYLGIHSVSSVD